MTWLDKQARDVEHAVATTKLAAVASVARTAA